jgi:sugar/nucleoside kinase (ribokinase family)
MTPRRAVVLGDLMTDVVVIVESEVAYDSDNPAQISLRSGGAAANVAAWMAHDDASVALVARRGDDQLGRAAEEQLTGTGVDCRFVVDPQRPTGTCVVISDHVRRTMFPDSGANAGWTGEELPEDLLRSGDLLHVSAYPLLDDDWRGAAALLERAREAGMRLVLDPAAASLIARIGTAEFWRRVGPVDLLLPNRDEAAILAEDGGAISSARALLGHAAEVIVKLDRDGAVRVVADAEPLLVPAASATVVDTTGAGDAFTAGLLTARLAGASPEVQLVRAAATAAACLALVGGRPPEADGSREP